MEDGMSDAMSATMTVAERLNKLFLVQLRNLLMDYVYLSEEVGDKAAREDFLRAAAWIEGKTKIQIAGQPLTFKEAMAIYMDLDPETEEFQERFLQFRRNFLQKANDPRWESRNSHR